ncbi:hypothetical protein KIL84_000372 [Mauremys mutica]|uniref:Uncharacterized protein n=1 Tax=Mauremys mutica TaxID=74926 RepID=A0A9D4B3H3_9SAUR|nr:hypothetical protein KIL84_000372 [Mauremys mutica]
MGCIESHAVPQALSLPFWKEISAPRATARGEPVLGPTRAAPGSAPVHPAIEAQRPISSSPCRRESYNRNRCPCSGEPSQELHDSGMQIAQGVFAPCAAGPARGLCSAEVLQK